MDPQGGGVPEYPRNDGQLSKMLSLRSSQNDLANISSDSFSTDSASPQSISTASSARLPRPPHVIFRPATERRTPSTSNPGSGISLYPPVALDLDFPKTKSISQRIASVSMLKGSKVSHSEPSSQKKALKRLQSEPCLNSWEANNVVPRGELLKSLQPHGRARTHTQTAPAAAGAVPGSRSRSDSLSLSEPTDSYSDSGEDASASTAAEAPNADAHWVLKEDETGVRCVSSGTLDRLVQHLADDLNTQDKSYIDIFLKTHRYFVDSVKLMDKLMDRFFAPVPHFPTASSTTSSPSRQETSSPASAPTASSPSTSAPLPSKGEVRQLYIQLRLVNVLKHWLEHEPQDFELPELRAALLLQLARMKQRGDKYEKWASHLEALLMLPHPLRVVGKPPKPLLPSSKDSARFARGDVSFLDLHPLELARQMTLLEFRMFASIRMREYHQKAWARQASASRIIQFIERFNKTSYWVASEILLTPSPKQRITVLSRFIEVAKHLDELGNFNGVMEILSALSFSFIKRLRNVWKEVPSKLMKVLKRLDDTMDQAGSYRNYRLALAARPLPALPFQGVYLTDLTFIEEKHDRLHNGHINFEKMWSLHRVFLDIQRYQATGYSFEEIPTIQEYLHEPGLILTEDQLWSHSKKCEPSVEAPAPDMRSASLPGADPRAADTASSASHTPPSSNASQNSPRASSAGGSPVRLPSGGINEDDSGADSPVSATAVVSQHRMRRSNTTHGSHSSRHHRSSSNGAGKPHKKEHKKEKRISGAEHHRHGAVVPTVSNTAPSELPHTVNKRASTPAIPSPLSAPPSMPLPSSAMLQDAASLPLANSHSYIARGGSSSPGGPLSSGSTGGTLPSPKSADAAREKRT